jgi:1,4-alpha-glucan branching enzyme
MKRTRISRNPHGAEIQLDGTVRFRLWAPRCQHVELELANERDRLRMNHITEGWHELITDRAGPGSRYGFRLPDGMRVPDPASRTSLRMCMGAAR